MRTRLFEPLGMADTIIEDRTTVVDGGWSKSGLPVEPWVMGDYAPGGGAVSTARDLATFAIALLDGTAPGMASLDPTTPTGYDGIRIGAFWHVTTSPDGQVVTWHNGQTGGYSSHFVLDRAAGRAAIVLSDVSNPAVVDLGNELLASLL
jgi:CubicO group peptidase (beta-lactamase class C family)